MTTPKAMNMKSSNQGGLIIHTMECKQLSLRQKIIMVSWGQLM